jgi:hypothetical protein
MEDIVERYAKEARSEFDSQPQGFLWPKFPLDDVYKLIVAKRDTIFNAPDAQLSALIRAQADMADLYRLMPKSCASAAVGGGPVQEENSDSPLSEAQVKKLGVVTAASLEAIQAGFTNYLTRPANGAEILDAKQSFVRTFAKSIDLSDDDPVRALPESDRCEFFLAYLNWLASLPPNQAAAFVSYAYDANSSSRPVYAETPYSLIPLAVVEPNAELMRSEPARD